MLRNGATTMKIQLLISMAFFFAFSLGNAQGQQQKRPTQASAIPKTIDSMDKHDFRVGYLFGLENYDVSGNGRFSADTGSENGDGFSGTYVFHRNDYFLRLHYEDLTTEYSVPISYQQPSKAKSQLTRVILDYNFRLNPPVGERTFKSVGVGLERRSRESAKTRGDLLAATNAIRAEYLPNYIRTGVLFSADFKKEINQFFYGEWGAGLFIPLIYGDKGQNTGIVKWSVSPEVRANVVYMVNNLIDFSVGFAALYERTEYQGSGTRLIHTATEQFWNVTFPAELRVTF